MLPSPFHLFYLVELSDYWSRQWALECHSSVYQSPLMVSGHNVGIFTIPFASRLIHFVMARSSWCAFEGHRLQFATTPLLFLSYSLYVFS